MKKRTFLLFEILIAFLLVTLCLVPLISQPLKLYRTDMIFLEELERERLADWTFTEVKEKLLKHEIPWEKLPSKGNKLNSISLPPSVIQIPGCTPKKIERSFVLSCRGEKIGLQDEIYRSIWITIDFSPNLLKKKKSSYKFRLTIQKIPIAKTDSSEQASL